MECGNDIFLAKQLKDGNIKAYEFLMDRFYQNLCSYAYTLSGDHHYSEDIVQNVFTRLWINRKSIKPSLSIKNFLYRSVYNEFINQYRKNRRVTYLERKYFQSLDLVMQEEPKDLESLVNLVNLEIEKLPPKCRRIFLLNKKEGLTHIEISEYLNVSIKTVEWHITKAFKILRENLKLSVVNLILFLLFDFRTQKA